MELPVLTWVFFYQMYAVFEDVKVSGRVNSRHQKALIALLAGKYRIRGTGHEA
jgi:hypothetical protein